MKELWRAANVDIEEFNSLYEVSNLGNVRKIMPDGYYYLKQTPNTSDYLSVWFISKKLKKFYTVHRLVALTFIDNPDNLPVVNHKDENKHNNCVENLEWCDRTYNNNYGSHNEKVSRSLKGRRPSNAVRVIDLNTNTIYDSKDAARRALHMKYKFIKAMCDGSLDEYRGIRLREYK